MIIAINDFISGRGTSGSSRGARFIRQAAELVGKTVTVMPRPEQGGRIRRGFGMMYWDVLGSLRSARRSGASVIIHTANTGGALRTLPSVVVVHDTMVLDHPKFFDRGYWLYARVMFGHAVRRASVVVVPSEHSKRRVLAWWPSARVRVIHWPNDGIHPNPPGWPERTDTILMVTSADGHKRIPMGIEAVRRLRDESETDFKLQIVLRPGPAMARVREAVSLTDPSGKWISVVSGLEEFELHRLYEMSRVLLVPSLDEGFCLPALEASSMGLPVVHADRGALPEVVPWSPDPVSSSENPEEDAKILARRLNSVLSSRAQWDARQEFGLRCASKFGVKVFDSSWAELLREVVSGANRDLARFK